MSEIPEENLFFSTIGLSEEIGYDETLDVYDRLGIERVELGYCPDSTASPAKAALEADFQLICHNYCLPDEPRFINLASADETIREWSVSYIRRIIDFCSKHGINLYSIHGGFRVDPDKNLDFEGDPTPYDVAFQTFVEELEPLAEYAASHDVMLGVENHVVEETHLDDGENRLLMFCRANEYERLFEAISSENVGVLLDLGHLRVASNTLQFDPGEFGQFRERVVAFHLHENDGQTDRHDPVQSEGWGVRFYRDNFYQTSVPVVVESYFDGPAELARTRRHITG